MRENLTAFLHDLFDGFRFLAKDVLQGVLGVFINWGLPKMGDVILIAFFRWDTPG